MYESIAGERWRPVVGHEDRYQVSDHGRVWSNLYCRLLAPDVTHNGRLIVALYRVNVRRRAQVHRLVLEAFVGPCPDGMECCHGPGGHADNRLTNLRWDTKSANTLDSVAAGTHRNARRTHCACGQELVVLSPERGRGCRACKRVQQRRRAKRQRERLRSKIARGQSSDEAVE